MIKEKNIFIVGIKGVAMSNLAVILKKMGKEVSGSDVKEEFITDMTLKKNKIKCLIGFNPDKLPKNIDLVIYSAAHQGINNPQVKEAKKRGIKIYSGAEILGNLSKQFKTTIAICGCHGKTTVASLLSYSLIKLGVRLTYLVGSSSFNDYDGSDYGSDDYFVVEADEYGVNPPFDKKPKFLHLQPKYIICTNIDFDHPDVYKDIEETKNAFLSFFKQTVFNGLETKIKPRLFLCRDDENLMTVAKKLPKISYVTFGFNKKADFRIINHKVDESQSSFELEINPKLKLIKSNNLNLSFKLSLFGEKNISNAAGVIALLFYLGYPYFQIKKAIVDFIGAKRRFEKIAYFNDIFLFDDYAHHPKEIETTIKAAKKRFPQKKILIIFQPHTYSRTKALLKDFSLSLSLADKSLILPIFPSAREKKDDFSISSEDIVKYGDRKRLTAVKSKKELLKKLAFILKKNYVIFTMGAGDVYKLKDDIIKIISKIRCQNLKH